ncbi:glycine cleavage T C-terminal barrel domain-containing protein [Rubinisphaera sp.]|uniref:CAF17-like 4Fe-4S cluster assembly/insertion protein YgfZ n=1 Tax=Rubinisphaera sp. TaxID=2024857 RepID=UPI000C11CC54|nr:glycine cleavage T C-terminal barrel domain-containing protein [Rubinisphaera sp.]MBV09746.1 hypothetical protein [Rubinisphaera sp.]HCS50484.1 hypothetical protein [Planctomycetaceae bacterium]|tara:strand:- start:3249 stop:4232 length:984 start_codon:yes stop_codon:yes gene_type:complete
MPNIINQLNQQTVAFDLSDRDEITLTGRDRATFLHGFTTNDIKKLQPGMGCEAFVPTIKGKTLGHIFVFATEDRLLLDTVPGAAKVLLPHLDRYLITEDVQLKHTTAERSLFLIAGKTAEKSMAEFCDSVNSLAMNHWKPTVHSELTGSIRKVDWLNEPAFQISVPVDERQKLVSWLEQQQIPTGSSEDYELIRIASGFPMFGQDFSEENLAQEVDRTSQAISFTKGCYLGQEPIARIDALGHVNKLIRAFRCENTQSSIQPEQFIGANLTAEQSTEAKVIGGITSAAQNPETSEILAIGWVRREFSEPKTELIVTIEGKMIPAQVR